MADEIKFEKAISELEGIVSELEGGDISLEDSIKKYEKGVKLSRLCMEKLSQAERKVEVLAKTLSGEVVKEDFDLDQDESTGALKKTRKKKTVSKKESELEGGLF